MGELTIFDCVKRWVVNASLEKMAKALIDFGVTDKYCNSDCETQCNQGDCNHELECCMRWLCKQVKDEVNVNDGY
ncbi:MAG: hypothetical protein RR263_00595 [Oscillospiraceae bacterium]